MNIEKDEFKTKDLPEAALLFTRSKKLIRLEKDNERFHFVFEDKLACQELIDLFWRKEALVDAKTFADSLRSLKGLIFSRENK